MGVEATATLEGLNVHQPLLHRWLFSIFNPLSYTFKFQVFGKDCYRFDSTMGAPVFASVETLDTNCFFLP
ncbi:MAG: hypothetical protein MUE99_09855, partial [Chitinophagaceae bacterium]|nr:hypothetical protein [Chitinophagaceae bacterium]